MRTEILTPHHRPEDAISPAISEAWRAGASAVVQVFGVSADIAATCAIWTHELPTLAGRRLGYIGRFDCADGAAAAEALEAACTWLTREGCQLAVGPIDGSTWHRYRFVTESSTEPPFFMELTNPPGWPDFWTSAGFVPLASYHSSLNEQLTSQDPMLDDASSRAKAAGLSVRTLNLDKFDRELRAIFELSIEAFADNYLYTPISWDDFAAMYARMKTLLDPRLMLLCDDPLHPGTLAGCIMAIPDALERQRTGECRTVILKSMAVHARWRSVGLGTWLVAQAQANARTLGMSRSIFALMQDGNHSARISKYYSLVIRRYTLFARELAE